MKLLNCLECHDIVSLVPNYHTNGGKRHCWCEQSQAGYVDELWVEYSGPCRILGMINSEYSLSIKAKVIPYLTRYDWFPIPEGNNIKRID